jgi:hypothetical protein
MSRARLVALALAALLPCLGMQAPPTAPAPIANADAPLPVRGINALGGRIFHVPQGLAFESIAPFLKPGDEVLLLKGVHAPFTLTDLRGERGKPIIIHGELGEEPARYPLIKAAAFGIRLVRPQHVIVRDLMVANGVGPLVMVEGEPNADPGAAPWEANVKLFGLRLMQNMPSPEQCGLLLRGVSRVDASNMSIRGWNLAAVAVERSQQCSVQQVVLEVANGLPQAIGMQVGQGCRQIAFGLLTFGPRVGTAFRIGACEGAPPDAPRCAEVLVSRCSVPEAKCFLSLGAAEKVRIEWNTVTDPTRCVWRAEPECGPPLEIQFDHNLFAWMPGGIELLCEVPSTVPAESVQLQANLWFSAEIPAAFEEIGKPFGVQLAPQVLDVDPRMESKDASPREPKAQGFGWRAGLNTPPAAAKPPSEASTPPPPAAPAP